MGAVSQGAAFYRPGVGRWRPQSSECRLGTGQTAQGRVHGWWAPGEDRAWEPLASRSVWGQVGELPRVELLCPELEQVAPGGVAFAVCWASGCSAGLRGQPLPSPQLPQALGLHSAARSFCGG